MLAGIPALVQLQHPTHRFPGRQVETFALFLSLAGGPALTA